MKKNCIVERKKVVMNKRLFEQLKEDYNVDCPDTLNGWLNISKISVNGEIEKHYSTKQYHNTPIKNLGSIIKHGKIGGEKFGGVVHSSANIMTGYNIASMHINMNYRYNLKRLLCAFALKTNVLEQIYFNCDHSPKIELYKRFECRLLEWDLKAVSELIFFCDIRDLKPKYRALIYQVATDYPHIRIYDKSREKNKRRCVYDPYKKDDYTLLKMA